MAVLDDGYWRWECVPCSSLKTVICPMAWCVTPGDPETPVGAPCRPWEVAVGVVWQSVLAAVLVVVGPHGCWAEARVAVGLVWLDL